MPVKAKWQRSDNWGNWMRNQNGEFHLKGHNNETKLHKIMYRDLKTKVLEKNESLIR